MFTHGEAEVVGHVPGSSKKRKIDPVMKAWMDNVFVPAMVQLYLAENRIAQDNKDSSESERVQ